MPPIFRLKFFAILALSMALVPAFADDPRTTVDHLPGLWVQVDEKTGKTQSLVRIRKIAAGTYEGVVEKIFVASGEDENPRCEACIGTNKNQPIRGMRIISGLQRVASNNDAYDGGEILDPDSGEVYRLKVIVLDAGMRLDIRGFIGISLFGRSQIWSRTRAEVQ